MEQTIMITAQEHKFSEETAARGFMAALAEHGIQTILARRTYRDGRQEWIVKTLRHA